MVEALVAVSDIPPTVLSWDEVPGVQPMCTIDDAVEAESIILNDPIVAKLVKERYGVTDVKKQLVADPWYYGARTGRSLASNARAVHDMHARHMTPLMH